MDDKLADRICQLLDQGLPAVVATIINRMGSAPRTAGSKMVVDDKGGFLGTIGGGKVEADVLTKARQCLAAGRPHRMSFDLSHQDVSRMDMICGGKIEILVDYLAPRKETAAVFATWRQALTKSMNGSMVTVMAGENGHVDRTMHFFLAGNRIAGGDFRISDAQSKQVTQIASNGPGVHTIEGGADQFLVEPVTSPKTLVLFGAGHVSMPTARMAAEVGFRVVVVDDRSEFANKQRFLSANEIVVPGNFSKAFSHLQIDSKTFIVIVTRGHLYDKEVLARCLCTEAGYIGMIGSRRKRDAIYAALEKEGYASEALARVHSPIGVSIGAETPEEIAVSIVAELIACRAKKLQ